MMIIEKGKSYEFYLMPNLHNLQNPCEEIKYTLKDDPRQLAVKYFMYVLNDDKIEILVAGRKIVDYIRIHLQGHYTNENRDFVSKEKVSEYLINEEGEYVFVNYDVSEEDIEHYLEEGFTLHNDVEYIDPVNPFDINKGLKLKFETSDENGFLKISNLKFIESAPIYKEGDDKDQILKLYDGVAKIEDFIEDHKKEMTSRFDFIFGDEARMKVKKTRFKEI